VLYPIAREHSLLAGGCKEPWNWAGLLKSQLLHHKLLHINDSIECRTDRKNMGSKDWVVLLT
jgi:hypothetical protein